MSSRWWLHLLVRTLEEERVWGMEGGEENEGTRRLDF